MRNTEGKEYTPNETLIRLKYGGELPFDNPGAVPSDAVDCWTITDEKLLVARIDGRTEACDFIGTLIETFRKLGWEDAAKLLDEKIEDFANT